MHPRYIASRFVALLVALALAALAARSAEPRKVDALIRNWASAFDFCAIAHLGAPGPKIEGMKTAEYVPTTTYWGDAKEVKDRLLEITDGLEDKLFGREFIILVNARNEIPLKARARGKRPIAFSRVAVTGDGLWVGYIGGEGDKKIEWDHVRDVLAAIGKDRAAAKKQEGNKDPVEQHERPIPGPPSTLSSRDNAAEQGGADQPATAPESKSEGKEEPKPESEGRSQ